MAFDNQSVVTLFGTVGSYFVDCYYKHIFASASAAVGNGSLADEYVKQVQSYVVGIKTDSRYYNIVLNEARKMYSIVSSQIGYAEFVNLLVSSCTPKEYYIHFTSEVKDEILGSIICNLVSGLAAFVTTPEILPRVLDTRYRISKSSALEVVQVLQEKAVRILMEERTNLYNKFLKKQGQVRDIRSSDEYENMQKAIRTLVRQKSDLTVSLKEAVNMLKKSKATETKLRRYIELIQSSKERGPAVVGATMHIPRQDNLAEEEEGSLLDSDPEETVDENFFEETPLPVVTESIKDCIE
jgi:hypothetical protein